MYNRKRLEKKRRKRFDDFVEGRRRDQSSKEEDIYKSEKRE